MDDSLECQCLSTCLINLFEDSIEVKVVSSQRQKGLRAFNFAKNGLRSCLRGSKWILGL